MVDIGTLVMGPWFEIFLGQDQGRPWTGAGGAAALGLQESRGPSLYIREHIENVLKTNVKSNQTALYVLLFLSICCCVLVGLAPHSTCHPLENMHLVVKKENI
jgi:hypothetical protein